jgi:hypothetical protein
VSLIRAQSMQDENSTGGRNRMGKSKGSSSTAFQAFSSSKVIDLISALSYLSTIL